MSPKKLQDSLTEVSIIARPEDANTIGTVFGGRIMYWMDMAAAVCARRHSNLRVVTASVDGMQFLAPLKVGQVMRLVAHINRAFASSMEIEVNVYGEDTYRAEEFLAAKAFFNIVVFDQQDRPAKVPEFIPQGPEEQQRWEQAGRRRGL
jgi:acyl-CoA hydrolase